MFSADHLTLKLLRLGASEEWESPGKGFSFLFPKEGAAVYVVGPLAHRLNPGDVLVVNGEPKGRMSNGDGSDVAIWLFSVSFEHLYPLFASVELGLLAGVVEKLKHTRLYGASTPVATECHRLLVTAPPRLGFEHRMQLLRVAATVLAEELKAAEAGHGGYRSDEHIVEVLDRLSARDMLNLSVEELAQKFGFCRRHLNRLFHQFFGLSISRLRMEMRLLKAVTLLRNPNAKVINVAEECGFNHLGLFNTSFKRRFGASPGQWRNQSSGIEGGPADSRLNGGLCALRKAGFCPLQADEVSSAGKPASAPAKGNSGSGTRRAASRPRKATPRRPL